MTTASCSEKLHNTKTIYQATETTGNMQKEGFSFHKNSKEQICNDFIPSDSTISGGIIFNDKTAVEENSASPFKLKSYLSIALTKCHRKNFNDKVCGFTIYSAFGIRMISVSADEKSIFYLINGNIFLHVMVDENGNPYSFATKKVGRRFSDSLSNGGVPVYDNIDKEYKRLYHKYKSKNKKYPGLSLFSFSPSELNEVFLFQKNVNRDVYIEYNGKLFKSSMVTTDLYNPMIKYNGEVISKGFSYKHDRFPIVINKPFENSNGQIENLSSKFYFIGNRIFNFKKIVHPNIIENQWNFFGKKSKFFCKADKNIFIINRVYKEIPLKIIQNNDQLINRKILYFFGGPAGQFTNEYPGEFIRRASSNRYDIIIPYYGSSVGAGLNVSRKFHKNPDASVSEDSVNISSYISKEKVDIVAYSFGAIPAISFATMFPQKVRNLIIVAPYIFHRDPHSYIENSYKADYQTSIENSWFGTEDNEKRPKFNKFLINSYLKLSKSGVKTYFVFGKNDRVSKFTDLPKQLNKNNSYFYFIDGDHEMVTIHPDTNNHIFSILGI
jgi:pimeloyl-ACP methyl ester carboxylesterase